MVTTGRNQFMLQVICVLAPLASVAHSAAAESWPFGYDQSKPDGPQHWSDLHAQWGLCKTGREQSPIAIHAWNGITDKSLTKLNTSYVPANFYLVNNGHAIEVGVADNGNAGRFQLDGITYLLKQFHFHIPSEHMVDGRRYPLEMHLVHKTADGKSLAVIGLLFKPGRSSSFLDQFWGKLPKLRGNQELDIGQLDVSGSNLKFGPSYSRYKGSLTTPPCTEGVTWTVTLDKWNNISSHQLRALKKIIFEKYEEARNGRPLQDLNG